MKVSHAWLMLFAAPAFCQTAPTDCHMVGDSVQCASVVVQPLPNTQLDAMVKREQQRLQAEKHKTQANDAIHKAALTQQGPTDGQKGDSHGQQTEVAQSERVNVEVAALQSAWDKLKAEDQALPAKDRYPPELLPRIAINEAAQTLGRQPLDRSVETFRKQIGQ